MARARKRKPLPPAKKLGSKSTQSARERAYRAARENFKGAHKSERGKVIYLSLKGTRQKDEGRRALPFFVHKSGRITAVRAKRAKGDSRRGRLLPQILPRSFDATRSTLPPSGKESAVKAITEALPDPLTLKARSLSLEAIAKGFIPWAERHFRGRQKLSFDVLTTIQLPDGKQRTISSYDTLATARIGGGIAPEHLRAYVFQRFYADLADQLAARSMVPSGSASRVAKYTRNLDKPRSQWVKRNGEKWGKQNFEVVTLKRIDVTAMRVMPARSKLSRAAKKRLGYRK